MGVRGKGIGAGGEGSRKGGCVWVCVFVRGEGVMEV